MLVDELAARRSGLDRTQLCCLKLQKSHDVTTLSRCVRRELRKADGARGRQGATRRRGVSEICFVDRQLIDLFLRLIPRSSSPEQLTGLLRPLPGRLYSVASSLKAHPGETHLLVGAVRWESHGQSVRKGRVFDLSRRTPESGSNAARIYVKPNRHYRLPSDGHTPIIMIGAGTGVAPYRAFVEERVADRRQGQKLAVLRRTELHQ